MNDKDYANKPIIVCLCGSTRYMEAFAAAGWELTLMGQIVLTIGVCKHADSHGGEALGPDVAQRLDALHLRKIDIADWVLILNVGGYVGESTAGERNYARDTGKPLAYLTTGQMSKSPPLLDKVEDRNAVARLTREAFGLVEQGVLARRARGKIAT